MCAICMAAVHQRLKNATPKPVSQQDTAAEIAGQQEDTRIEIEEEHYAG